ncbi:MAG TPA: GHMP kinase [Thermoanaerobacterales bacterium]|nr:GHMP kinase [Thermoanaerobacterales bacterium]
MYSRIVTARCPGSCGELVEGVLNGRDFLITCPINLYSYVTAKISYVNKDIICPPNYDKTLKAVKRLFKYLDIKDVGVSLTIDSQIPLGLGMASSTADITAACIATASALDRKIGPDEIANIALSIEPSDGTMFPGVVMIDFLRGTMIKYIGELPNMEILVVDLGGQINTTNFYKERSLLTDKFKKKDESLISEAIHLIKSGIHNKDVFEIGLGSILSARENQKLLYKPKLEKIIDISKKLGASGVNIAHSGTVVGIMFLGDNNNFNLAKRLIRNEIGFVNRFFETKTTNIGPEIVKEGN